MVLLPCSKCCGPCWRCYEKTLSGICPPDPVAQCGGVIYPSSVSVKMNATNFQPLIRPQNAFDIADISGPEATAMFGNLSFNYIDDGVDGYSVYANRDIETGELIRQPQGNPPLYSGKSPRPNYGLLGCDDAPFPPIDPCDICTATYDSTDPDCAPYITVESYGNFRILCSSSFEIDPADGVQKPRHIVYLDRIRLYAALTRDNEVLQIGGNKRYSLTLFRDTQDWQATPGFPFVIAESWGDFPTGIIKKTISIPFNDRGNPGIYQYQPNIACYVQQRMNRTCDEIINKPNGQANQCVVDALFSMDGGLEVDVTLTAGDGLVGRCCLQNGECLNTTQADCVKNCGVFSAGISCEDEPCYAVESKTEFQCFETPPAEEGWLPVSKCHPTEEECAKECGPWQCYGKYTSTGLTPIPSNCPPCPETQLNYADTIQASFSYSEIKYTGGNAPEGELEVSQLEQTVTVIEKFDFINTATNNYWFGYSPPHPPADNWPHTFCEPEIAGFLGSSTEVLLPCYSGDVSIKSPGLTLWGYYYSDQPVGYMQFQFLPDSPQRIDRCESNTDTIVIEFSGSANGFINQCKERDNRNSTYEFKDALLTLTIPLVTEETTGTCCLPNGSCTITTRQDCSDPLARWTPRETCADNPCDITEPETHQCFDAPPDEEGWLPIGGKHADEATCQAACPSDTPPPGGRTMPTTKTTGPGTELANLFKWFNIHAKEGGCACKSMQKKMDRGGPQWCRAHKDEILAHLEKEAKKRGLPFIKLAASKLIDLAIRRSERG